MAIRRYYQNGDSDKLWKDFEDMSSQMKNVIENECADIVEDIIDELYEDGAYESFEDDEEETEPVIKEDASYDRDRFAERLTEDIDGSRLVIENWKAQAVCFIYWSDADDIRKSYDLNKGDYSSIAFYLLFDKCMEIANDNYDFN